MKSVRIWFKKTGSFQYVSHLDLTRFMARILKICKIPVWYTEGFNPRMYMTFAMPLSLGVSGEAECMEIRLIETLAFEEIVQRLNSKLPPDIQVIQVADPVYKFEEIAFALYEMTLFAEDGKKLFSELGDLLSLKELVILKHGKKGDKELDILPYFSHVKPVLTSEEAITFSCRLPCSVGGSINPNLLLEALKKYKSIEPHAKIVRKGLLTEKLEDFR